MYIQTFLTDAATASIRDATPDNVAFFNQELTRIIGTIYETRYRAIKYREYFNIDSEGGAGITSIKTYIWDMVGSAKIIGDYSDDLPTAGAGAAEATVGVRWVGASAITSWMEVQQAQLANRPLPQRRVDAANRAIEQKLNAIAFGTDEEGTDAGLYGMLSHPNIPEGTLTAGAATGATTAWTTKTPNEILADVQNSQITMSNSTYATFMPNKIALPVLQWNILATTRMNDLTTDTILDFLVSKSPYISSVDDVVMMPELAGAGPNGEDMMLVYDDGADNAVMYIPYEKDTPMGTQVDGLHFKTPIVASTAGVDVRFPLAFNKVLGI